MASYIEWKTWPLDNWLYSDSNPGRVVSEFEYNWPLAPEEVAVGISFNLSCWKLMIIREIPWALLSHGKAIQKPELCIMLLTAAMKWHTTRVPCINAPNHVFPIIKQTQYIHFLLRYMETQWTPKSKALEHRRVAMLVYIQHNLSL